MVIYIVRDCKNGSLFLEFLRIVTLSELDFVLQFILNYTNSENITIEKKM